MKRLALTTLLVAAFLLSPRSGAGASPLSLRTYPDGGVYFTVRTIELQAKVERHSGNRILQVMLECNNGYIAVSTQYITEDSPINFYFKFVRIPDGECQGHAGILREDRGKMKEYVAETPILTVTGPGPSFSL